MEYSVIRFIEEVPFKGIDEYVCVPHSWIVARRWSDKKVVVAYPNDEDPFVTRDRVERKERYSEFCPFYLAEIIYETETYKDAEYWIATRSDYMPLVEKNPRRKAARPEPTMDSELPSSSRSHSSKSTRDKPQLTPKLIGNLQKMKKRAAHSEAAEQLNKERRRQNDAAQPSSSAGNNIKIEPGYSRRELSPVIGEHDLAEAATISSSDKSTPSKLTSGKRHRSSPVRQAKKQLPSLPIIDVDEPTEAICFNKEDHLQDARQSSEANDNSQSQRANNTKTALMASPQTSTSVRQPPSSHQPDHRRHTQDRKNSHVQTIKTGVRSIKETDTNHALRTDRYKPYVSHRLPSSQKMSARLYSHMDEKPSLIPMHEPFEMRLRLVNSERLMAIAPQTPSNLIDQRRLSPERQVPTVTQNSSSKTPFQIKIGKSYDNNALDPKDVLERINNVVNGIQHTPSLPHQRPSFVQRIFKRQHSPPLEQSTMDVTDALQRHSKPHSVAQRTSREEALMHEASTVQCQPNSAANQPNAGALQSYQNNLGNSHQEQRQELRRTPTEGINLAQPTHTGIKINIPPCHLISTNMANETILSSNSSQQRQSSPYLRDTLQQLRPSELQVGILTNASNDKRLPTGQGVSQRSPPPQTSIPDSMRQSLTNTYTDYQLKLQQLEEKLKAKLIDDHVPGSKVPSQNIIPAAPGETRSLERPSCSSQPDRRELLWSCNDNIYQPSLPQQRLTHQLPEIAMKRVYSEGNIVNTSAVRSPPRSADHVRQTNQRMAVDPVCLDPEVAVDHGCIPEQETLTNNADCAETSGGQGSASANNQLDTRIVLEQQMLDYFATILTQMGSSLYYSCEMYENLRSSILETADTYKKMVEVGNRFNALEAAEEERQTGAAKKPNSSNLNQYSSRVDKEPLNNNKRTIQWKIVLPPEYDPNNTEWTLKYRKIMPELKELLPGRGIYVNSTKLKYAERVSGNCKTLAALLLEEVFSATALVVCSTWHETQSPNKIERPLLDPVAWHALFDYVIWYGSVHGWNIATGEIIKAMDNKIYEKRVKHNVFPEP